ncbi:MAG: flagellar hook-length control protein FliK [Lachnospiraceae bacterium]|nr:flagellar hook-length control protein FliK [Lachnospiraceae bacterium]
MEKTTGAVNLFNQTAGTGLNNLPNIGKSEQSTKEISFADTFMKTNEVNFNKDVTSDVSKTKTVVATNAGSNKNIKTAEASGQETESLDEEKIKDLAEEISEITNQIVDKIKSEFEVTDEEIEEAMEVLGLTIADLTKPAELRNLLMELTGTSDSIELLTNVELYDSVKEVTDFASNLFTEVAKDFSLSTEQLTEMINTESFEEALNEVDVSVKTNEAEAEVEVEAEAEIVSEVTVDKTTDAALAFENSDKAKANETKPVESNNSNESEEVPIDTEKKAPDKIEKPESFAQSNLMNDEAMNERSENRKSFNFDSSKNQEFTFNQTQAVTNQTVNTVGDIVETVTSYTTGTDTDNIMRQVTDYVKVHISEDVTKMEIELHPASLGTVNMQINSQNGQITAHLTVQNELVKSVLETQMIKLQETFDEQGTKVSAIEVTVAEYSLNSQSDNNYSEERNGRNYGSKKKGINLNEIGSLDELDEEEQLEAKVMEMNGSSVNYTA